MEAEVKPTEFDQRPLCIAADAVFFRVIRAFRGQSGREFEFGQSGSSFRLAKQPHQSFFLNHDTACLLFFILCNGRHLIRSFFLQRQS